MWSLLVLVSVSILFAFSVCVDDIAFSLGSRVVTFLEIAVHSVKHMLSFCYVYL